MTDSDNDSSFTTVEQVMSSTSDLLDHYEGGRLLLMRDSPDSVNPEEYRQFIDDVIIKLIAHVGRLSSFVVGEHIARKEAEGDR